MKNNVTKVFSANDIADNRIPANVRAAQLDAKTRETLAVVAGLQGSKRSKRSLIDEILRDEDYTEDEIENRGPVALTNLFKL